MAQTFTLQLLHASDQEAGIPALKDAIGFSAVMNALEGKYTNTLKLTSGDVYIAGPFYDASRSIYDFASEKEPANQPGIADVLIQNALGWDAAAVGNHEFDLGDSNFFNLIAPNSDIVNGAEGGVGIGAGGYPGTSYPYLATNLDYSEAELPEGLQVVEGAMPPKSNSLTSSVVIDVKGEDVGVLSAVTPYLPAIANIGDVKMTTGDNITATTPIQQQVDVLVDSLKTEVKALEDKNVNKIVLMTHLQEAEIEQALAQELVDQNIPVDIIIGGGSHRVMADPETPLREDETQTSPQKLQPYPQEFGNGNTKIYYVNTGANYRYLSQIVPTFDANGIITSIGSDSQTFATDIAGVDRLYTDDIKTFEDVKAKADPEIVDIVDNLGNYVNDLDGNIYGQSNYFLNGIRGQVRTEETNLGNLSADAQDYYAEEYLKQYGEQLLKGFDEIHISFKNGGGIRDSIGVSFIQGGTNQLTQLPPQANPEVGKEEGDVSQLDISNSLRFDNTLTVGTVTAEGLYELAEHMVSGVENISGRFGQIGGFKFSYDPTAQSRTDTQPGQRIQNLVLTDEEGKNLETIIENRKLLGDPNRTFSVVTLGFLAGGGDSYPDVIKNQVELGSLTEPSSLGKANLTAGGEQDALAEYLAAFYNQKNGQEPYSVEDTPVAEDDRIQNLEFREDTILEDTQPPLPEVPKLVFGTSGDDVFDTEDPTEKQFIGDNQILFTGSGNDSVDITFAPGGATSRVNLGSGDDYLFAGSNHRILAGSGDDILLFGSGEGNNVITGNGGNDQFWVVTDAVDLPAKPNVITDFNKKDGEKDVIGFADTDLDFSSLTLTQSGSKTIINALGQDLVILNSVESTSLTSDNFMFV